MVQSNPVSLWDTTAVEAEIDNPLDGDSTCDVAIVGGGFTGLSTALHGAQKGLDCHVLEAKTIGHGGSGRNAGLVNAGLWMPPSEVYEKLGTTTGTRLVATLGDMPEYVFSLIEKHQIRCEATRRGTIHAAHAPSGFENLSQRAEAWQALGAPVDLLDAEETANLTGTRKYVGGLLDHRAGTINPMGYTRGLARAALGAGARISTGVQVTGLAPAIDGWKVSTDRGTISANRVVIATNAYSDDLWPLLRQTYTVIHYFQVATDPLGERSAGILKGGQGLWDTAPIMTSVRKDAFGRLIVGSMGTVLGSVSRRWAAKRLNRLFPDLGPVSFETAWHGQIAMTPDHLFRIHRLADGLYTPIGYNGRGITTGTMFGQALAELFTGADDETLPVPISEPSSVPARTLKTGFLRMALAANQFVRSL